MRLRYEVITWDGCGYWKSYSANTRKNSRDVKFMMTKKFNPTTTWENHSQVKIYDRKCKEFIILPKE